MARTRIYLDICTIPTQSGIARTAVEAKVRPPGNLKKTETLAAWERDERPALRDEAWRKTAFDGSVGHLVAFGYAVGNKDTRSDTWVHGWDDTKRYPDYIEQEGFCLNGTFDEITCLLDGEQHPQIVCHHSGFVLRFLTHRSIVLGQRLPTWWPRDLKPWGTDILDLMVAWAGVGNHISLAALCQALDLNPPKDGGDVHDMWRAGDYDGLERHSRFKLDRIREISGRILAAYGEAA